MMSWSLSEIPDKGFRTPVPPSSMKGNDAFHSTNINTNIEMKTELNTKLVAILSTAMTAGLKAIVKGENTLIAALEKAWGDFITSKDGSDEHWTYFDESGAPKRHGVLEFREAVKAAAEKGGYNPMYVAGFLPSVDHCFVMRVRKAGEKRPGKVKFSEAQLESVTKAALSLSLSRAQVKQLIAALSA